MRRTDPSRLSASPESEYERPTTIVPICKDTWDERLNKPPSCRTSLPHPPAAFRHPDIPVLELKFDEAKGTVDYPWKVDEKDFVMPIKVGGGGPQNWELITPTTDWQTPKTPLKKDEFDVATNFYYVNVSKT
jgi:hypothetical protein